LLNTREHLESLIEAKQMGVPSIQQFLQSRQGDGHEPHEHAHDDGHDHPNDHSQDHVDDHAHNHEAPPLAVVSGKRGRE
jgi:ABC-type Zn2+ transport system substrate-binding protein/surface adhesin